MSALALRPWLGFSKGGDLGQGSAPTFALDVNTALEGDDSWSGLNRCQEARE